MKSGVCSQVLARTAYVVDPEIDVHSGRSTGGKASGQLYLIECLDHKPVFPGRHRRNVRNGWRLCRLAVGIKIAVPVEIRPTPLKGTTGREAVSVHMTAVSDEGKFQSTLYKNPQGDTIGDVIRGHPHALPEQPLPLQGRPASGTAMSLPVDVIIAQMNGMMNFALMGSYSHGFWWQWL